MFLTHIFGSNWPIYLSIFLRQILAKETFNLAWRHTKGWSHTQHFQRFPWLASQEVWRSAHQQAVRHRVGPTFAWPKPTWLFSVGSFEGKSLWKQSPNSPGTENINRQANPKNHQRTDQKRDWPLRQTRQNLPPEGRGSFGACSLSCSKNNEKIYTMTWNFVQTSCKAWI